jgi:hypothetical protein
MIRGATVDVGVALLSLAGCADDGGAAGTIAQVCQADLRAPFAV